MLLMGKRFTFHEPGSEGSVVWRCFDKLIGVTSGNSPSNEPISRISLGGDAVAGCGFSPGGNACLQSSYSILK